MILHLDIKNFFTEAYKCGTSVCVGLSLDVYMLFVVKRSSLLGGVPTILPYSLYQNRGPNTDIFDPTSHH